MELEPSAVEHVIAERYLLRERLGAGGMGWVYRAVDSTLRNQVVAVKILYPHHVNTPAAFARFRNEVSVTRRLSHPHIVQTFGFGRTDDMLLYLTMEYVAGLTLKEKIQRESGSMPFERIGQLVLQLVEALNYAHNQGVIHRDIKPENVLVAGGQTIKIADFGLAQTLREEGRLAGTGAMVGTPYYMSPEQIQGQALSCRSDIYSLGILCYELAAGEPPFRGDSLYAVADQHLHAALAPLNGCGGRLPAWFDEFLAKMTAKSPEERFGSLEEASHYLAARGLQMPGDRKLLSLRSESVPLRERGVTFFLLRFGKPLLALFVVLGALLGLAAYSRRNASGRQFVSYWVFSAEKIFRADLHTVRSVFGIPGKFGDPQSLFIDTRQTYALLMAGMDPNVQHERTGDTVVHIYAKDISLSESGLQRFKRVLDLRPQLEIRNVRRQTALHAALLRNNYPACQLLLDHGANPNALMRNGWPPLIKAVDEGLPQFTELLLLRGADPNGKERRGRTALHFAAAHADAALIRLLLEYGADPNASDKAGVTPSMLLSEKKERSPAVRRALEELAGYKRSGEAQSSDS